MKNVVLSTVLGLAILTGPAMAQEEIVQDFSEVKTNDLNGLLKINPYTAAVISELKTRADAGDVTAMIRVGDALRTGNGVEKDVEAGLEYLQSAAQTGNAWGLTSFGNALYRHGEDIDNDQYKSTALGALQAAFAKGHGDAAITISQKLPEDWTMYVQQQLVTRGYYLGTPDGVNGPLTQNALRLFCEDREITADCSAGVFDNTVVRAVFRQIVQEQQ